MTVTSCVLAGVTLCTKVSVPCLHAEILRIALLRLFHLRITSSGLILSRRFYDRRIHDRARIKSRSKRTLPLIANNFLVRSCFSNKCRNLHIVVSSGTWLISTRAKTRTDLLSKSASSMVGIPKPLHEIDAEHGFKRNRRSPLG